MICPGCSVRMDNQESDPNVWHCFHCGVFVVDGERHDPDDEEKDHEDLSV